MKEQAEAMAKGVGGKVVGIRQKGDVIAYRVRLTQGGKIHAKYVVFDGEKQPVWMRRKQFRTWLRKTARSASTG